MEGLRLQRQQARKKAAAIVAPPDTSEHQLGLAVELVDASYQTRDSRQADTPAQKWLRAHCWEYGFILRYPTDKSDVTGIIYEPWHYRYVGRDYARQIYESGLCLEEWLDKRQEARAVESAIAAGLEDARRRAFVMLWHQK